MQPWRHLHLALHLTQRAFIIIILPLTFKSPEILAPARIPVAAGKNIENTEKKSWPSRKSGCKFSANTSPVQKKEESEIHF